MSEQDFQLEQALVQRFAAIVGDNYALSDQRDIAPYLVEPRGLWHGRTSLVLRPGSVEEVSRIMRLATETGTPIVPQSGNTGLVGAQMPDASGREIVLSLSRLNRIREIDTLSNTATVEAGVILQTLHEAADAAGRLFPLSLAAQGSCQIGGNLSSNAGGTGVLAYGNARELCLGVEVVLPTGEVFDDLRKLKKDNTGYDLKDLFVGAEGTLGVITAAVVKLFPRPKGREVAFAALETPQAALDLLSLATDRAGAALTAFELIGRRPYEFTLRHAAGVTRPLEGDWPWYAFLEISSGRSAEDARGLMEEILGAGLEDGTIGDATIAQSLAQAEALDKMLEGKGLKLDAVLELKVDQSKLVDRIVRRAEEARAAGQPVRKDDDPEVFKTRLEAYNRDTAIVAPYYAKRGQPTEIDGMHPIDAVSAAIEGALSETVRG